MNLHPSKVAAIIPAAGRGLRMGLPLPKQFVELDGIPIIIHTLRIFQEIAAIGHIVVVVPADNCEPVSDLISRYQLDKVSDVVAGGRERQDSVLAGLKSLPKESELVLVHDGVRPFVPVSVVENCLQEAGKSGAAMAAIPVKDTLKSVTDQKVIRQTVNRAGIWQAQTPQAAAKKILQRAYQKAAEISDYTATDEAGLLELIGQPVKVVEGSEKNIKVTRPEDLVLAKAILMENESIKSSSEKSQYSCGYGYDAHRLVSGRPLVLGGKEIPHDKGLLGHSDADVLTHSLCDAMLGAAGLGDIGKHFPDTDQKFKDISSIRILKDVAEMVAAKGYRLANADITVAAQSPKLALHFKEMQKNLAEACNVAPEMLNLKATTTEGLGFVGRGEGMSAHAVVMLQKI